MKGLLDFLQSASNAVASQVTGPIDLINSGLGAVGVPVSKTPIGGSEWMKRKGLLADVQQGPASIAGETFGLLAPTLMVAKAPQIAQGLLKAGDNLAAPRTLNKETGAIVWHGSPHKFSKFDSSKIGTGEGAQAYGHGLYLAEAPEVAGSYAQSVKANSGELVKRGAAHGLPEDVASNLAAALQSGKKFDPVLDAARKMIDDPLASASQRAAAQRLIDNEMAAYNAWSEWSKPGSLYKVDLPDDAIAKMLDWDRPLSQQASEVQAFVKQRAARQIQEATKSVDGWGGLGKPYSFMDETTGSQFLQSLRDGSDSLQNITGGGGRDVSMMLRDAGIPGIRYLDGGSRGAGAGTSNFVVFPGNEGLLTILERNGQPLK